MIFLIKKIIYALFFSEELIQYGLLLSLPNSLNTDPRLLFPLFLIITLISIFLYNNYYYCSKYILKANYYCNEKEFNKINIISFLSLTFYTVSLFFVTSTALNYLMKILSIYNKNIFSFKMLTALLTSIFLFYLIIGEKKNITILMRITKLLFFIALLIFVITNPLQKFCYQNYLNKISFNNLSFFSQLHVFFYLFLGRENLFLFLTKIDKNNYLEKKQFYFISKYGYIINFLIYSAFFILFYNFFYLKSFSQSTAPIFFQWLLSQYIKKIKYINFLIGLFIIPMFLFIYKTIIQTTQVIKYLIEEKMNIKNIPELILLFMNLIILIIIFKIPLNDKLKIIISIIFLYIGILFYFFAGKLAIKKKFKESLDQNKLKKISLDISIIIIFILLLIMILTTLFPF